MSAAVGPGKGEDAERGGQRVASARAAGVPGRRPRAGEERAGRVRAPRPRHVAEAAVVALPLRETSARVAQRLALVAALPRREQAAVETVRRRERADRQRQRVDRLLVLVALEPRG